MIQIETHRGVKHFTKAVFVWTGHFGSGWPTSFPHYVYNDQINGLLTYGHDDEDVNELTWFIPNGVVPLGKNTCADSEQALRSFKQFYGDRLIVWMNAKEGMPMLSTWALSDYVVTPADLKFEAFTGESRAEFKAWAQQYLGVISAPDQTIVMPKQV